MVRYFEREKQLLEERLEVLYQQDDKHRETCVECPFQYARCNEENDICEYCPAFEHFQQLGNQLTRIEGETRELRITKRIARRARYGKKPQTQTPSTNLETVGNTGDIKRHQ